MANLTVGAEVFHTTPAEADGGAETRFKVRAILDLGDRFHLIASAGRGLQGPNQCQGYLALRVTLGRPEEGASAPPE
jgi:hypothetical protein